MVDAAIILIVIVLLFIALKGSVKHFRGEGPCCGGGSAPRTGRKHLDGPVVAERTVRIGGMHCSSCAERVKGAVARLDGAACAVALDSQTAHVRMDRTIDDSEIRKAISDAGYDVISIS